MTTEPITYSCSKLLQVSTRFSSGLSSGDSYSRFFYRRSLPNNRRTRLIVVSVSTHTQRERERLYTSDTTVINGSSDISGQHPSRLVLTGLVSRLLVLLVQERRKAAVEVTSWFTAHDATRSSTSQTRAKAWRAEIHPNSKHENYISLAHVHDSQWIYTHSHVSWIIFVITIRRNEKNSFPRFN